MLHALTIAARPSGGATCQVIRLAGLVGVVLDGLRQCAQAGGSGLQGLRLAGAVLGQGTAVTQQRVGRSLHAASHIHNGAHHLRQIAGRDIGIVLDAGKDTCAAPASRAPRSPDASARGKPDCSSRWPTTAVIRALSCSTIARKS